MPVLTILFGVYVGPAIYCLYISFTDYRIGLEHDYSFVGFENYLVTIDDPIFRISLLNTLIFSISAVTLELLIGLGIAFLLCHRFPLQKVIFSILITPYIISTVIGAVGFKFLLDPNFGLVNNLLNLFDLQKMGWYADPSTSLFTVVMLEVWQYTPFTMIILHAAIQSLPKEPLEAAIIDGANSWQRVRYIMLPLIRPAVLMAVLFRTIVVLRSFDSAWLLTEGGPGSTTEILSIYIFKRVFKYFAIGWSAAVAIMMLVITIMITYILVRKILGQR